MPLFLCKKRGVDLVALFCIMVKYMFYNMFLSFFAFLCCKTYKIILLSQKKAVPLHRN